MVNDGQDLEWVQDFRAIIHSRNGLYRHRFQKQIVLTHRDCTISLECTDSDEIKASMTFHTPCDTHSVNEVEDVADGFLINLRLSLLLRGYLIKIIGKKNLHRTNAEKGRRLRVTSAHPIVYRIEGKTKAAKYSIALINVFNYRHKKNLHQLDTRYTIQEQRARDYQICGWLATEGTCERSAHIPQPRIHKEESTGKGKQKILNPT